MITIKEISESIRSKGLDPYNLENLLNELKSQPNDFDKDEIIDYLASNKNFEYHSTQNDISWLMAEIGRTYKPNNVVDLSCGLGNILFHIDYCNSLGFEINKNIVDIAKFISPNINIQNTDSINQDYKEKFDAIISHFPFGKIQIDGRKDDIENIFIQKSIQLLNKNGVLICLVPEKLLYSTTNEYFRQKIIEENHLKAIISLPAGFFQKTAIKMSIIVLEKNKSANATHYIKYSNSEDTLSSFINNKNGFFVVNENLLKRWDTNYHLPEHSELENTLKNENTKKIRELSNIVIGFNQAKIGREKGKYLLLQPKNIKNGILVEYDDDKYVEKVDLYRRINTILKEGDIVIPRIFNDFKKLYIHQHGSRLAVAGPHLIILRSENNEYLRTYLTTIEGRKLFNQQVQRNIKGGIMPLISVSDVKNFRIPILPVENIQQLTKDNLDSLNQSQLKVLKEKLEKSIQQNSKLKEENLTLKARVSLTNEMISKLDLLINKTDIIDGKIDKVLDEIKIFKRLKTCHAQKKVKF